MKHWYNYLWLWSLLYFSLGFFNIIFAWLGLISFLLPLVFAIGYGNKLFCNRYCDRGQTLRALGLLGLSRNREMPGWMKGKIFRYVFMAIFFSMFGVVLYKTWLVYSGADSLTAAVSLFMTFHIPWDWSYAGLSDWSAQFAFGLYGFFWTSEIIALVLLFLYKPRSWCVCCPMGTLTQLICKSKAGE